MLRALNAARRVQMKDLMMRVKQPAVDLLWGHEDRILTEGDIEAARKLLNVTQEKTTSCCGHWPMVEFPQIVSDYLLNGSSRGNER